MSSLPPMALEVTPEGLVIPVEAAPCGEMLEIPDRGIRLACDRPAGHAATHRQIVQLSPPHVVGWCDDHCAQPCEPLRGVLEGLRKQGLSIHQNRRDGQ